MATTVLAVLGVYAAAGMLFASAFVVRGIERIDAAAVGSGVGFRLIVLPGTVALWPVLLRRWMQAARDRSI